MKTMKIRTIAVFSSSALLAIISACNAKQAVAPRADVQASSVGTNLRVAKSFPRENIHIGPGGSKFFLWKMKTVEECPVRATLPIPGMSNPGGPTRPALGPCPDDVAFVLNVSNRASTQLITRESCTALIADKANAGLIALDDCSYLIRAEQNSIRSQALDLSIRSSDGKLLGADDLIKLIDSVPDLERSRDTLSQQQEATKNQRRQKQSQLDAEQSKPQTDQNAALIAQLKREISSLDSRIANFQRRIDQILVQINDAGNASRKVVDSRFDDRLDLFRTDIKKSNEISSLTDTLLNQVKNTVDFFDYSDNLTIDFSFAGTDGIGVDIKGWDFRIPGPDGNPIGEEGEKSFSTSDKTITGVTYVELGGTFEFDVLAPDARYHFKVSRARYGAADRLAHFNGDILRYSKDGSDAANPRRGVAVMDEQTTGATLSSH